MFFPAFPIFYKKKSKSFLNDTSNARPRTRSALSRRCDVSELLTNYSSIEFSESKKVHSRCVSVIEFIERFSIHTLKKEIIKLQDFFHVAYLSLKKRVEKKFLKN